MTMDIRTESDLSTGEKNTLVNNLTSKGYRRVTDTQFPGKLEFTVSSYRSDPQCPRDPQSWIVKFDPR